MFANPERFDDAEQIAVKAEQYQALKDETHSLWEEWERLSLKAEALDSQLAALKTG